MLKLLLCLFCALAIAVVMLQSRQQQLALTYEAARMQEEIERAQAKLWSQQLQIAVWTAPNAIANTVAQHELKLVPEAKLPPAAGDWLALRSDKKP